ncbi:1,4-dihydroxy-2-naphthoate polyprenyltransferase [bacterium]|nr:1,4-dihydroxy-2-naphthoate polyprenyltransferase [bacterium]
MDDATRPGKLATWILAARPKTLPAAVLPVLIGGVLARADGVFVPAPCLAALAGALLIQIGTNFTNDLFDFLKGTDDADRLGPVRATQAGLVTPTQMKIAIFVAFKLAVLVGIYLVMRGGWPVVVIGLSSILCGVLYTAGPRPLGYLGLGDLFVLLFYGPVAVGGTYYVITLDVTPAVLALSIPPALMATAILAVNNLRDIDGDRRAGKRTLAVRFGRSFARLEYVALILVAACFPLLFAFGETGRPRVALTLLVLPAAVPILLTVLRETDGPVLNGALAATGRLMLLYGLLFAIGWSL